MFAFPAAEAKEADYSKDIEIMNSFGFLSLVDAASSENLVTRSEFAGLVDLLLDLDVGNGADGWFADVDKTHVNFEYIAAAAKAGIVHGIDGKFYPDRTITYSEAAAMLVNALGGKNVAEYEGAYAGGYLKLAENLGIKKNVTAGSDTSVTVGMAARLLLNAGKAEVFTPVISGEDINLEKGGTLFWEKQKIDWGKGILSANKYTSIDGGAKTGKNTVRIGDFEGAIYYSSTEVDYLGYNVDYYFREEDGDNVIYYMEPTSNKNEVRVISELDSFDEDTLTLRYEYEGKDKKTVVKADTVVIYNGMRMVRYYIDGETIFNTNNGEIKLIDNDGDGEFEVISILAFKDYFVSGVDANEGIIYDMYTYPKLNFKESDMDGNEWVITDETGKVINYSNVEEKTILSVAMSEDGTYMRAVISKDKVSAAVSKVYVKDGILTMEIGGQEYEVLISEKLKSDRAAKIKELEAKGEEHPNVSYVELLPAVGSNVTAYIGFMGKISAIETGRASAGYGFVIRKYYDDNNDKYMLRMLTTDGSKDMIQLAKNVKIDGETYREKDGSLNEYMKTFEDYQMVLYKLNGNDELSMIDTEKKNIGGASDSLRAFSEEASKKTYYDSQNSMNGAFSFADEVTAFETPANDPSTKYDLDLYSIGSKPSGFGIEYTLRAFSSSDKSFLADGIQIVKGDASSSYNVTSPYMLVSYVEETINEDGEPIKRFKGYKNKTEVTYDLSADYEYKADSNGAIDANDIIPGDIIRYTLNARSEISYVVPIKRFGTAGALGAYAVDKQLSGVAGWFSHTSFCLRSGYLQSREGKYIGLVATEDKLSETFIQPDTIFGIEGVTAIYHVSKGKGGVGAVELIDNSSLGSLVTYQNSKVKTEVYCVLQNAHLNMLVVYE